MLTPKPEEGAPVTPPEQARKQNSPWVIILIVVGACATVGLAIVVVLAAIMFPVFSQARRSARKTGCMSNMKQMTTAILMYTQDFDERLPLKENWSDGISPYHKNAAVTLCPEAPGLTYGYAYNSRLSGLSQSVIANPATQPEIYDSTLGIPNGTDTLESFAARHSGQPPSGNVGFVDGHVKALPTAPASDAGLSLK